MRFRDILAAIVMVVMLSESVAAERDYGFITPLDRTIELSGNYGKLRPNHFHSGVDIRVGGVSGAPIRAMADGHIVRLFVSPYGYGKALYVEHKNGYTSVYAHLDRFAPRFAEYATKNHYSRRSFNLDLFPPKSETFAVKRGEIIGYAGNSGSSGGPHLHLDIRRTTDVVPLDIIDRGMLTVKDTIRPYITKLYRVEIDTLLGAPRHRITASYTPRRIAAGRYRIAEVDRVNIRRNTYFAIEVRERKNGNNFSLSANEIVQKIDGEEYFGFKVDAIPFSQTRMSNALGYYPLSRKSRDCVYRLMRLPGNTLKIYRTKINDGVIDCSKGVTRRVDISVKDDCGNSSTLSFDIYGYPYSDQELATQRMVDDSTIQRTLQSSVLPVVQFDKPFSYQYDELRFLLPAQTLYENAVVEVRKDQTVDGALTERYVIGDENIPLHKAMSLSIDCSAISLPEDKLLVAAVDAEGRLRSLGGEVAENRISTKVSYFGSFVVACDTIAPKIEPRRWPKGGDMRGQKSLSFSISDNLSGIASIVGTIDGKWALFDYDAKSNRITHIFDSRRFEYGGRRHVIDVVVVDGCGNSSKYVGQFVR